MTTSIQNALKVATAALSETSDTAKLDAQLLLCHVIDKNKTYLHTWSDKALSDQQLKSFNELISQRQAGHPVAHLIGHREFWDLNLKVNASTLIPRPDTETLVETVLERIHDLKDDGKLMDARVSGLDLGTGTGAIALALAKSLPQSHWLGVDFNIDAVELAQNNAESNRVTNCKFCQSNWFENVPNEAFQIIVSNPPYIDPDDAHLELGDVRFEPKSALIADDHGLADLKLIASQSKKYLSKPGFIVLEHGYDQGAAVRAILNDSGFSKVETIKDLGNNDRISLGYLL